MKPKLIFLFFILLSIFNRSQSLGNEKKNIVKTNLTAYVFKNFNISYERAIAKWFSINVSYGSMSEGSPPFQNLYLPEDDAENYNNIKLSGNQFTVEPRFYVGGKGYGQGFYLAPYFRRSQFNINNLIYEYYSESSQEDIPLSITGKITANSFGLLIGNQWVFGRNKNWVIDFWILGGHYGKSKGTLDGKTDRKLSALQQQELKEQLDNQELPLIKYTTQTSENGIVVTLDGPWAGLRSGLSFGYRF